MIGDTLSSRSADTLSLLRQNQTSPAKADTDSLQLVDLHAVQEVDSGFEGTPISYSPRTDDAIALTLLACFFLSSIALARGKKFLSQQVKDFVLHRERTSIFDSSTAADVRYLLVLVLQTCVLSGITFLNYFHDTCPALMNRVSPLLLLGIYVGFCLAYFLLKWLIYMFLGWTFFDKNKTNIWLESYSALIYYVGFALFPFVLFLVYPHVLLDAPQSAACERCIAEPQEKLLFAHCEPLPIRNRQRVEQGIEMRRAVHGGFLVVGTAALAAIAAEDPSVEVGQGAVGLLFDRTTGDATVRVDHLGRDDGSRRTTVQAVPAAAATGSCERSIVLVGRQGKYQLAQQDIGAVLGREQQGLPPDPAQTRFDGQLFFQQRSRIDERAAREPGVLPAQGFEHRAQHPLEDGVVVAAAGVGGDFCAAPGRIAFAQRVLVAHGADHDRLRPFDQVSDVETFVEVAFEVFQRGTVAFGEPFAEVGFVLRKMLAGRDSAEVEACILGKFFDVLTRDHGDNSAQK